MNILEMHKLLNSTYEKAEEINKVLNKLQYKTTFKSFNHHYININGNYYKQKYFMPVISIENRGDICFNLNIIEYEFYITKEEVNKIDLASLINNYAKELNIYELNNCTIDLYKIGDTKEDVLNKINKSLDNKFGISINCTKFSNNNIIKHFNQISLLLNKVK